MKSSQRPVEFFEIPWLLPEMSRDIRDRREVLNDEENNLIFEKNVSVPVPGTELPLRANIYRPNTTGRKSPVLVTYGPYGKDIWYGT